MAERNNALSNEFLARVKSLPEDKRRLLNLLLRKEAAERPELAQPYVEPRNDLEKKLAGIWSRVLGLQRVGVQDHFIELGGDSILAIQMIAMAREAGMTITTKQLYRSPTVESLAAALSTPDLDNA
ncbi:MAG TPA: phosphopantetheine-binding protein [Candidatus Dormibacteraeota bacterium]|nr:phosphopantetheine-binding protein [Candidatus Dormibacteraeota bacterium]